MTSKYLPTIGNVEGLAANLRAAQAECGPRPLELLESSDPLARLHGAILLIETDGYACVMRVVEELDLKGNLTAYEDACRADAILAAECITTLHGLLEAVGVHLPTDD